MIHSWKHEGTSYEVSSSDPCSIKYKGSNGKMIVASYARACIHEILRLKKELEEIKGTNNDSRN